MSDVRIRLPLVIERQPDGTEWPPVEVEFVAATRVDSDVYRLQEPPIFNELLNVRDTIYAPVDPTSNSASFVSVRGRSGYRTIRVRPDTQSKEALQAAMTILGLLQDGGCVAAHDEEFEILAIGLPPNAQLAAKMILAAETEHVWECNAYDRDRLIAELALPAE